MNIIRLKNFLCIITLACFLVSSIACAPKARKPESMLDTPEHHVLTGHRLIKNGDYDGAVREFKLALDLDRKFSRAHTGMGIALGYFGDFKGAYESLRNGVDYAREKDEDLAYHTGMLRVITLEMKGDWLGDAEDEWEEAIDIDPKSSEAYFYMGQAYKKSYEFDRSGEMFKKVLNLNADYLAEANKEWEEVQKIQRAAPGTHIGKVIALIDEITRADISALFIQELDLERLYKKRNLARFDTSFKSPESPKFQADTIIKAPEVIDIDGHVLQADVQTILNLGIRGLEPGPDHLFHPDKVIIRAEFAMMIEDILIKIIPDPTLATKFIGIDSPFVDLRNDLPYFNAVMVCRMRGMIEAKDPTTNEFAPLDPVSGADALLTIRKLKEQLF